MRLLELTLAQPLLHATGRALLHSLWQGALVAALLAALLSLLRGKSPALRYTLACGALALTLLSPAATVWLTKAQATGAEFDETVYAKATTAESNYASTTGAHANEQAHGATTGAAQEPRMKHPAEGLEGLLPWLTLVWVAGVFVFSARTLGGLMYARRLRSFETRGVAESLEEKLKEMAARMRVARPVKLLESSLVRVPTAVGWLRPAILLPASALSGLTPQQLEIILAHELAHIRRHDYLLNILQTVAETLLFYHPAVWWISRQVRAEREHVCDDLAVEACGDALAYARALSTLERLRRESPRLALAADGGSLKGRVLRLVGASQPSRGFSPVLPGVILAAAACLTVVCARAVFSQKREVAARATAQRLTTQRAASRAKTGATHKLSPEMASLIAADVTDGEDEEVRRAALAALGSRAGSVVVLDPRTGRVYAVVNQEWALRRGWTPASTMKLVTSLAGVSERVIDPAEKLRVSQKSGSLNMTDALALSDNSYFTSLGGRVGAEMIINYARRFGLGEPTGINYEGESAGRLPAPKYAPNAGRLGAYGEGVEVTAVQLAAMISAVGNGGRLLVPRVPRTAEEAARFETQERRQVGASVETLRQLAAGMNEAVERGTATGAKGLPVKIAGKTGTISSKNSGLGLFASYAPADDPRLVVVVLTSGKGENGAEAANVAASIYKSLGRLLY